jgi:2-isopropylmalate synthase
VALPDRTWPERSIIRPPAWCSIDLRDGNQALEVPLGIEEKTILFELLVRIGFKEIEVGFPAASDTEFRFVRMLIEEDRVPEDVTIQVLTPAREALIEKTMQSLIGARSAVVHLYNSTSPEQRRWVFEKNRDQVKGIAVNGVTAVRRIVEAARMRGIRLEYSPESFTGTELDYALQVCRAVQDAWKPSPGNPLILNLPSTVEMSTPNVYADRIEWFDRNIENRDAVVLSVHTHNDRGTAVAAAELALLAGADRVEGALFGNGERSGNLCLVTLALNLYSRGVDPGLDFSRIDSVRETVERLTRIPVHPRHPYAGDRVYTAFSGSHQDAIGKGMQAFEREGGAWRVPYLPIDPRDVGRGLDSIIRINSQSGKGGAAYVLERAAGIQLPRWMRGDFGKVIQEKAERRARELKPAELEAAFRETYIENNGPFRLEECRILSGEEPEGGKKRFPARVHACIGNNGSRVDFEGRGNGPLDAFVRGLCRKTKRRFEVERFSEHALERGSDSRAVAFVGISMPGNRRSFGAGIDTGIAIASIRAVLSALNRFDKAP